MLGLARAHPFCTRSPAGWELAVYLEQEPQRETAQVSIPTPVFPLPGSALAAQGQHGDPGLSLQLLVSEGVVSGGLPDNQATRVTLPALSHLGSLRE